MGSPSRDIIPPPPPTVILLLNVLFFSRIFVSTVLIIFLNLFLVFLATLISSSHHASPSSSSSLPPFVLAILRLPQAVLLVLALGRGGGSEMESALGHRLIEFFRGVLLILQTNFWKTILNQAATASFHNLAN